MSDKPRDILEFLRRAGSEPTPEAATTPPDARATVVAQSPRPLREAQKAASEADLSRWLLVKRRQIWIAAIAAGLFAVLTFVVGYSWGSPNEPEAVAPSNIGVWTIYVIVYDNTSNGEIRAKTTAAQLRRMAKDEVTVQALDRNRKLVVTVGSWLKDPKANKDALEMLEWVQSRKADGRDQHPFKSAYFSRIQR